MTLSSSLLTFLSWRERRRRIVDKHKESASRVGLHYRATSTVGCCPPLQRRSSSNLSLLFHLRKRGVSSKPFRFVGFFIIFFSLLILITGEGGDHLCLRTRIIPRLASVRVKRRSDILSTENSHTT